MDQMSKSKDLVHEAKEDIKEVPKKSGPAELLVLFYVVAAIVGLAVIAFLLWGRW